MAVKLVVLLELIAASRPPASVSEVAALTTKPTSVTIDAARVSSEVGRGATAVAATLAAKATVSAAAAAAREPKACAALDTSVFCLVCSGLLSLCSDAVDVAEEIGQLLGAIPDVDALVLAILVDEVELPKHLEEGKVGSGVIDDTFGAVLDQILEQLKGFVDLSPFLGGFLCEPPVDHGHDLVEGLAAAATRGQLI